MPDSTWAPVTSNFLLELNERIIITQSLTHDVTAIKKKKTFLSTI